MQTPGWMRGAARACFWLLVAASVAWVTLITAICCVDVSGPKAREHLILFFFPHLIALVCLLPLLHALRKKTCSWRAPLVVVCLVFLLSPAQWLAAWALVRGSGRPLGETRALFEPGQSALFLKETPTARGYGAAQREERARLWLDGEVFHSMAFQGEDGRVYLYRLKDGPIFAESNRCESGLNDKWSPLKYTVDRAVQALRQDGADLAAQQRLRKRLLEEHAADKAVCEALSRQARRAFLAAEQILAADQAPRLLRYTVRCRLRVLPLYRILSVDVNDNQNGERIAWDRGYEPLWWGHGVNRLFLSRLVLEDQDETIGGWGIHNFDKSIDAMITASFLRLRERKENAGGKPAGD